MTVWASATGYVAAQNHSGRSSLRARPRAERYAPLRTYLADLRGRIDPQVAALGTYVRLPSRRGKPVTQEELAEAIGVTRQWIVILANARGRASAALLHRLADALMITPEERAMLFHLAMPDLKLWTFAAVPPPPMALTGVGVAIGHEPRYAQAKV